jgi:hypothetical protein
MSSRHTSTSREGPFGLPLALLRATGATWWEKHRSLPQLHAMEWK